jgi:hypothetical protein
MFVCIIHVNIIKLDLFLLDIWHFYSRLIFESRAGSTSTAPLGYIASCLTLYCKVLQSGLGSCLALHSKVLHLGMLLLLLSTLKGEPLG